MSKVRVRYMVVFGQPFQRMRGDGLLLVTLGPDGKPNVMTIGWTTIGFHSVAADLYHSGQALTPHLQPAETGERFDRECALTRAGSGSEPLRDDFRVRPRLVSRDGVDACAQP